MRIKSIIALQDLVLSNGLCLINKYGDIAIAVQLNNQWYYEESDGNFYKFTGRENFIAYFDLSDDDLGEMLEIKLTKEERAYIDMLKQHTEEQNKKVEEIFNKFRGYVESSDAEIKDSFTKILDSASKYECRGDKYVELVKTLLAIRFSGKPVTVPVKIIELLEDIITEVSVTIDLNICEDL